jgi:hypothetical protein
MPLGIALLKHGIWTQDLLSLKQDRCPKDYECRLFCEQITACSLCDCLLQVSYKLSSNFEGNVRIRNKRLPCSVFLVWLQFPKLKQVVETWRSGPAGSILTLPEFLPPPMPQESRLETFGPNQFLYFSFYFPFIITTDSSDKPSPFHRPQYKSSRPKKKIVSSHIILDASCKFQSLHKFWGYSWY